MNPLPLAALTALLASRTGAPAPLPPEPAPPPLAADTVVALEARPTLIAFFAVSPSDLEEQPALPMVISDFQFYLQRAERGIDSLQVGLHEVYGEGVRLSFDGREWELPVGGGLPIGYYLWSPTAAAYLCRGVRSDRDLVNVVREYLDVPRSGPGAALTRCERVGGAA